MTQDTSSASNKFESYYRKLIEYSQKNVEGPKIIGLSHFKNLEIYEVINQAHEIFDRYKSGDTDLSMAQNDILTLCSLGFLIAEYAGMLKGGAKSNSNIRKAQISSHAISIREKNLQDRSSDTGAAKLTDKAVTEMAEVACAKLTADMAEYESLAEIFYSTYNLIIHFTTILNSMLKREHENNRSFGSHST